VDLAGGFPQIPGIRPPSRALIRRTTKILLYCLLGYGLLWGVSAGGMLALSAWARQDAPSGERTSAGINHFLQVDAKVWRGSAPTAAGYRELAAQGIRTVVDLRAEDLSAKQLAEPLQAGLKSVRLPIRDGQTPTEQQVDDFIRIVQQSAGPVYVHCGAGVGRTGAMTAAYLVRTGEATADQAARRTVAVGPPSIEQVYYVLNVSHGDSDQPPALVRGISRLFDAPRRIMASL
jgi:protein-tyrosine phosphatase